MWLESCRIIIYLLLFLNTEIFAHRIWLIVFIHKVQRQNQSIGHLIQRILHRFTMYKDTGKGRASGVIPITIGHYDYSNLNMPFHY